MTRRWTIITVDHGIYIYMYRGSLCELPGGKYDSAKTVMGTVARASSASYRRGLVRYSRANGSAEFAADFHHRWWGGDHGWGGVYDGKGWVGENISIHQRIVAAWCINGPPTAGKGLGWTQSSNLKGRDVWYIYMPHAVAIYSVSWSFARYFE